MDQSNKIIGLIYQYSTTSDSRICNDLFETSFRCTDLSNIALNLLIKFKTIPNEDQENREKTKREIDSLNILRNEEIINKHVIRLYYSEICDNKLILILERCDTDLQQIMQNQKFSPVESLRIISQIVKGYEPLYRKNIIHRNLKPQNILFKMEQGENIFKISEFELARIIDQNKNMSNCGTLGYAAPQVIMKDPKYTSKVDVFSLGMIFYELIYGHIPNELNKESYSQLFKAMKKLETSPIQFEQIVGLSPQILELLSRMLKFSEADRIGWRELIDSKLMMDEYDNRNEIPEFEIKRQDMVQENNQQLQFNQINQEVDKNVFLTKIGPVSLEFEPLTQIYSFKLDGQVSLSDQCIMIGILHSSALQLLFKFSSVIEMEPILKIGSYIADDAIFYFKVSNQEILFQFSNLEIQRVRSWTNQQQRDRNLVQKFNIQIPSTTQKYLEMINEFPYRPNIQYPDENLYQRFINIKDCFISLRIFVNYD